MVPYPATTTATALPAPLNIYGSISGDGGGDAVELAAIWSAYQMRRWHRRSRKDGPAYLTSDQGMTQTSNYVNTMVWHKIFSWISCLNVPRFMPRALPSSVRPSSGRGLMAFDDCACAAAAAPRCARARTIPNGDDCDDDGSLCSTDRRLLVGSRAENSQDALESEKHSRRM